MVRILLLIQLLLVYILLTDAHALEVADLPGDFHADRRIALRELMPEKSVAVFFSYPIKTRSNDVDFQYKANPDLFYLSGYNQADAMLFVFKEEQVFKGQLTDHILFIPPKDEQYESWNGKRMSVGEAKRVLKLIGVSYTNSLNSFPGYFGAIDELFVQYPKGSINEGPGRKHSLKDVVLNFDNFIKPKYEKVNTVDIKKWMAQLREVKLPEEIMYIQKAIKATGNGLQEVMKAIEPGMTEKQAQAIIEYHFKAAGSEHPGFPSIIGAGENACILHYTDNNGTLESNDMLLMDVGAEINGYSADVTRTIPIDGKFSDEEKAIYELVLKAQEAGIKVCLNGNDFRAPHNAAIKIIAKGLVELGIIDTESDVRNYYMHGTSHYLGLDVHDMGTYGNLKSGVVLTVEPGIYIKAGSPCDQKWWNIGIRIEDDILVTDGEPQNLSGFIPKQVNDIEQVMAKKSLFNQMMNGNNH